MREMDEKKRTFPRRLSECTESAFGEVDDRYRNALIRLVEARMGKRFQAREDYEDVVQSALFSAYRFLKERPRSDRFDHSGAVWAWLLQKTCWKALQHIEYHGRGPRNLGAERSFTDLGNFLRGRGAPDEAVIVADLFEQLTEGLPDPYPAIAALLYLGHNERQIGEILGYSRGYVRNKIKRLRERLARLLEERSKQWVT